MANEIKTVEMDAEEFKAWLEYEGLPTGATAGMMRRPIADVREWLLQSPDSLSSGQRNFLRRIRVV